MALVTFIIPVRHQDNARDWQALKANLSETVRSIANQTNGDWQVVIVANEGADLPDLPAKVFAERVAFPPNDLHELGKGSKEDFLDAFRADKGRRVLAGMLRARDSRFFMIVDDDDLVSAQIVEFVSKHQSESGWTIDKGFIWDSGGKLLLGHDDFNHLCGTCLIIRSDLYGLPERFEDASLDWIKSMLGSHMRIPEALAARGTPLRPLPFRGAIYRVAHGGSHSRAPSLVRTYLINRKMLKRPARLLGNLAKVRLVTADMRAEFFGDGRPTPRAVSVPPPPASLPAATTD